MASNTIYDFFFEKFCIVKITIDNAKHSHKVEFVNIINNGVFLTDDFSKVQKFSCLFANYIAIRLGVNDKTTGVHYEAVKHNGIKDINEIVEFVKSIR